jgi:hypothetical protein
MLGAVTRAPLGRKFAAAALVFLPSQAQAQPVTSTPPGDPAPQASLDFRLAGACITAATFQSAVRMSLGREPFAPESPVTLHVDATSGDRRQMQVRVRLTEGERELGVRVVDVSLDNCARARETVAIVAAMLLEVPREPPAAEETPPPAPPPPPPPPPPPRPPKPKSLERRHVPVVVDASAFFAVTKGYLPGLALGGRAEVVVRIGRFLPLRVTAGGSAGETVETPDGSVAFSGPEFSLGAAPFSTTFGNRVSAFVFASAALTGVVASPEGFEVSNTTLRWIPALVAGAALRARPFGGGFIASVEASGFLTLAQPRFTVADSSDPAKDRELHQVSTAGFDAALGAGWQFR